MFKLVFRNISHIVYDPISIIHELKSNGLHKDPFQHTRTKTLKEKEKVYFLPRLEKIRRIAKYDMIYLLALKYLYFILKEFYMERST